ncbi:MAG TPA: peptidylprolyl isomerase [Pyrinomonadaceae bacterium]|jgi:peptidyl-prolyl cis-trans isomerase B (cyclophilin B)|nr:peptidylprolyl isomerase [Pyrinomonadaceae bacterium]
MVKPLVFLMILTSSSFLASGQTATTAPAVKEPIKTNARPAPAPAAKAEPFDKADVKTMAAQCVTFDTEAGVIEMEVFPEHAPESVRNFLNLAATGLFDTTVFGRVVPGFVIQGGDLYSREGKVTYEIGMRARRSLPDEPNKVLHERGILSMARGDEANSATTSFFILVGPGAHLDGKFAAFGRVTKGMEAVDAINKASVTDEKPEKPVRIKKATVRSCTPA